MTSEDRGAATGQRAACKQLKVLLLRVSPYRDTWEERARSIEADEINQAAVCQVIAEYLWDTGQREDSDDRLPRKLKDRVSDVINEIRLSPETLRWFVEAFGLSPHDTQRLYDLYRGDITLTAIMGSLPLPDPDSGIRQPDHRTTLLFEHHYVGRDGLPAHHHTQQTIYSLIDGLTSYQYRIDTAEVNIRVRRGGAPGKIYPIGHGYQ